jgi:hypothetical protein
VAVLRAPLLLSRPLVYTSTCTLLSHAGGTKLVMLGREGMEEIVEVPRQIVTLQGSGAEEYVQKGSLPHTCR